MIFRRQRGKIGIGPQPAARPPAPRVRRLIGRRRRPCRRPGRKPAPGPAPAGPAAATAGRRRQRQRRPAGHSGRDRRPSLRAAAPAPPASSCKAARLASVTSIAGEAQLAAVGQQQRAAVAHRGDLAVPIAVSLQPPARACAAAGDDGGKAAAATVSGFMAAIVGSRLPRRRFAGRRATWRASAV